MTPMNYDLRSGATADIFGLKPDTTRVGAAGLDDLSDIEIDEDDLVVDRLFEQWLLPALQHCGYRPFQAEGYLERLFGTPRCGTYSKEYRAVRLKTKSEKTVEFSVEDGALVGSGAGKVEVVPLNGKFRWRLKGFLNRVDHA